MEHDITASLPLTVQRAATSWRVIWIEIWGIKRGMYWGDSAVIKSITFWKYTDKAYTALNQEHHKYILSPK